MSKGFLGGAVVKNLSANAGGTKDVGSIPGLGISPEGRYLLKGMATCSSILARKFHGQRVLAGYSPWGWGKSDTTEHSTMYQELCEMLRIQ